MKMLGLQRAGGLAPFVSSDYLHLAYREEEREMLPLCRAEGIAVIPWSPMARGYLAGTKPPEGAATVRARTDSSQDDLGIGTGQDHAIRERVVAVADGLGTKPATVALAWVPRHPRRHRPDHRHLQAAPPPGRPGSAGVDAGCGDAGVSGAAVPAAEGGGARVAGGRRAVAPTPRSSWLRDCPSAQPWSGPISARQRVTPSSTRQAERLGSIAMHRARP